MSLKKGMYTIIMCIKVDRVAAAMRYGFTSGVTTKRELSSLKALNALNISIITKTESERVLALTLPAVKYLHGSFDKSMPSTKLLT